MPYRILTFCLLISSLGARAIAQPAAPKYEFRGAWIATVLNLDWPSSRNLSTAQQQADLIKIFDDLQRAGINAVVFQVRSETDAMYDSGFEPWSYWLTGSQGEPPDPYYDPLQFAIAEAHRRGMELHAWFNPYRSVREIGGYPLSPMHVSVQHPEWMLTFSKVSLKMLDPGLPAVREYITSIIMDVVRRYDIDGVHFDDYFYPYPVSGQNFPGITTEDAQTFAAQPRGFTDKSDWRRDNINLLVEMVYDSIQTVKPHVKFGISPFGIWQNGVPPGITGLDAYSAIYADALAWLGLEIIDYVAPQLYWRFGSGQDYGALQSWWAAQAFLRHVYVGQAVYRLDPNVSSGDWPLSELRNQINSNRSNPDVQGSIFFRAKFIQRDVKGFAGMLETEHYRHPALPPRMDWKDPDPPNAPQNLVYARRTGTYGLAWASPAAAANGDTAARYVVYRFSPPGLQPGDLDRAENMAGITGETTFEPPIPEIRGGGMYYAVTAADHNANESPISNVVEILAPAAPLLATPAPGQMHGETSVTLRWQSPAQTVQYSAQLGPDSTFAAGLLADTTVSDTFVTVRNLEGQADYFWRVSAANAGGHSPFSPVFAFFAGFPKTPRLAAPQNNLVGVPLDQRFAWRAAAGASTYHLQVASSSAFSPSLLVIDQPGLTDTTHTATGLEPRRVYYWRVRAANAAGAGNWSAAWRFKTGTATSVADRTGTPLRYTLLQNYPNPFNPLTHIPFTLPDAGRVQLEVYDLRGRKIATLLDRELPPGRYDIPLDASTWASGIYYYRLRVNRQVLTRKMALVR